MPLPRAGTLLVCPLLLLLLPQVQAFGAGNIDSISAVEGKNWSHGNIEDVFKTVAFVSGHKWTSTMIKRDADPVHNLTADAACASTHPRRVQVPASRLGKHQYEPWPDPTCTDPTQSLLSKEHFAMLNDPTGHVAAAVVHYAWGGATSTCLTTKLWTTACASSTRNNPLLNMDSALPNYEE